MKKVYSALISVILLTTMVLSMLVNASAATYPKHSLLITEVVPIVDPKDAAKGQINDSFDAFEIYNNTNAVLDLYDFKFMAKSAATAEDLAKIAAADVTSQVYFADAAGKYTLQPGEVAVVWVITAATYEAKGIKDDGTPDFQLFRDKINDWQVNGKSQTDPMPTTTKVIPLDITDKKLTETANVQSDIVFQNTVPTRMYIVPRGNGSTTISNAICIADYYSSNRQLSTIFAPNTNKDLVLDNTLGLAESDDTFKAKMTLGYFTDGQTIYFTKNPAIQIATPGTTAPTSSSTTTSPTTGSNEVMMMTVAAVAALFAVAFVHKNKKSAR